MIGKVQPQDTHSGLVERSWERISPRRGRSTERTLEGEQVEATWLDGYGGIQRASGVVKRNEASELAIESWADGIRKHTPVPRDARVDVISGQER